MRGIYRIISVTKTSQFFAFLTLEGVMEEIWTEMNAIDVLNETEWTGYVTTKLRDFERQLINAMR